MQEINEKPEKKKW